MKTKIIYRRGQPTNDLYDRKELIKITRLNDNRVVIDKDYSLSGRSVYLIKDIKKLDVIKKKRIIERNLKIGKVEDDLFIEIEKLMKN